MHFIDAWRELSPFDLGRLLIPVALLVGAALLPGRRVARIVALGVAASLPLLREAAGPPSLTAAWMALWAWIAWQVGEPQEARRSLRLTTRSVLESGAVGLLLGLSLLGLLVAAVARQDMAPEDSRRASYGVLLLAVGLFQLMLRRHVRRAAVSFATMGLGLQVLDGAARAVQVPAPWSSPFSVLLCTALAAAVVFRIAAGRERFARSPWVHDAHDLHD